MRGRNIVIASIYLSLITWRHAIEPGYESERPADKAWLDQYFISPSCIFVQSSFRLSALPVRFYSVMQHNHQRWGDPIVRVYTVERRKLATRLTRLHNAAGQGIWGNS